MMRELKQLYAESYNNLWMGSAAFFVPVLLHMLVAVIKEGSRYRRERRTYLRGLQKQD
jgi:hypothetical protein